MHCQNAGKKVRLRRIIRFVIPRLLAVCLVFTCAAFATRAQNVTTQHNDISRTGANTSETVLTPSNVNSSNFGKLFYYVVDGYIYAQPLYMANVTVGGTKHNVVFVATQHDSVYAFDADGNLGANAQPLWQITLLDAAHGATTSNATPELSSDFGYTDVVPEVGITSTPVIDPTTSTLYVVGKTKENGNYFYRLHALDITTGKEQFGGPITIAGSVQGTGSGSSGGTLTFSPTYQLQRPGLLLLNGVVYIAFGATYDVTPIWHGWIFGYKNNGTSLQRTGVWTGTPNGNGSSIWLSGAGLAADVVDPTGHPFGRLFTGTGNGSFNATTPYTNAMNYGISVLRLDLANGVPSMNTNGVQVGDMFAPFNQASLDNNDQDMASGGTLILPDVVISGKTTHFLVTSGKSGLVYLLDRDNLGGFNPNNTSDPQAKASVGGSIYGAPAYWNGHVYYWPAAGSGGGALKSFSFSGGNLSSQPTSSSAELSSFPGPSPAVSANGTTSGIVWSVRTDGYGSGGPAVLYAHDASTTPTLKLLYSSAQDAPRDTPGVAVKFATPTIANGKVYIGTQKQLAVYSLLNGATQAPAPVISPVSQEFHPSIQVTITDSDPSAQIFYTTDGTTPSTGSTLYTGAFTISSTSTVNAIAAGSGLIASTVSSETYTLINQVPTPVFNPGPGDFSSTQSVSIPSPWPGSTIYYTTDGTTPTTSSNLYGGPISISATTTLQAIATAPNLMQSNVGSGLYTIVPNAASSINFSNGFNSGSMALVGKTALSGTDLRLTDGGVTEAGAAWYPTKVNVQSFATDFTFQQTPGTTPRGDGLTFTVQGVSTSALGPNGGGLGYGPSLVGGTGGIANSVAVKFALFNNGKCNNCTGFYTNGASPTTPEIALGGGVNLQTGDVFAVHISYDGTTLTMTITDTANTSQTFTTSFAINIPGTVGGNTAYVGFTGATGHYTLVQDIQTWTYVSNTTGGQPTAATPAIAPTTGTYTSAQTVTITDTTSGANIYYTTDGSQPSASSTLYGNPFTVSSTTTVKAIAIASGFTQSGTATSVITISSQAQTSTPLISPGTGTYSSSQSVTITDATSGSNIYYTTDGSQPSTSSTLYGNAFTVSSTTTVKAIAIASGFTQSNTATSVITIQTGGSPPINYSSGFTASGLQFNGRTTLSGSRLQLTDGGQGEASSAWFTTPVNVQTFTNDFTFQFINANADGMTFTIQNAGTTALGPSGGGLGYGATLPGGTLGIPTSVAVKFDLFQNVHEGNNSTGLYTNGASPTSPSVTIGNGVSLHSGDVLQVHMTYDGTTLTMTITDTVTNAAFTTSFAINIPGTVGGNTALVGFTAGTGLQTITQIATWTYSSGGSTQPPAATPVISPSTNTFTSPQTVTITDTTSGANIYYTTDGSQPSASSTLYGNPFTVSTTTTVKAIAIASGFTQSNTATSVITINSQPQTATPSISPGTGTYNSAQTVTITDTTSGANIYYTTDGSQPSASSTVYGNPFTVSTTTTVKAIAIASGFTQSNTATSVITIQTGGSPPINYSSGFTANGLQFNGRTTLSGGRLQLTDGGQGEASSAWFTTPVNVQTFTNDFTFQFTNANADGMTFTIQNAGATALGPNGGGLGYGATLPGGTPGIPTSVAVKFDLFQNVHEGNNSTGLYTNGASPTSPSVTIGNGVSLHSGDVLQVHMTYDGTTLTMTITDTVTNAAFTTSFAINIPGTVGGNTALVGFTAGTGVQTITQIISWTYGP